MKNVKKVKKVKNVDDVILAGVHAITTQLNINPILITKVLIAKNNPALNNIKKLSKNNGIHCEEVNVDALDKLNTNIAHQGVIAYLKAKPLWHLSDLLANSKDKSVIVILDCIDSPHNLGACLRSCAAFDVQGLIVVKDKSASLNSASLKVAQGAHNFTKVVEVNNLHNAIDSLKQAGFWIVGASGVATDSINDFSWPEKTALVMGSEAKGMRKLTEDSCDMLVKIPISDNMESLNVSVACGVMLYSLSLR